MRDGIVLEFETNTLAFMTASLEQCCKKLRNDTPEARKLIADKLKECARSGRVGQAALREAGEEVVAELNRGTHTQKMTDWRGLFQWMI